MHSSTGMCCAPWDTVLSTNRDACTTASRPRFQPCRTVHAHDDNESPYTLHNVARTAQSSYSKLPILTQVMYYLQYKHKCLLAVSSSLLLALQGLLMLLAMDGLVHYYYY
jgi:hypothetical protein